MSIVELLRDNYEAVAIGSLLTGAALIAAIGSARIGVVVACVAAALALAVLLQASWRTLIADAAPAEGVVAFAAPLVAAGLLFTLVGASAVMRTEWGARAAPFGVALLLCAGSGWIGALFADDLVGLFAAVEAGWLCTVGVAALSGAQNRGAFSGAFRMLCAGGVGSAVTVLGIALASRAAGGFGLADLGSSNAAGESGVAVGAMLVMAGLAIKAGVAPLHDWVGAAYGRAGGATLLALSAVTAIGALAALGRVAVHASANPAIANGVTLGLIALGAASIVVGSVQAIGASHLGRLAGYASAAQAGCFLIAVGLASRVGLESATMQLVAHQAAMLGLLGGAAAAGPHLSLASVDGLFRRAPLASAAMAAAGLCLMGAPLTTGFLARWRLMEAGAGGGWWIAAVAAIGASVAGVFYGGRLIERIYFRRAEDSLQQPSRLRALALAPAMLAAIIGVGAGLNPEWLIRAANAAAELALAASP